VAVVAEEEVVVIVVTVVVAVVAVAVAVVQVKLKMAVKGNEMVAEEGVEEGAVAATVACAFAEIIAKAAVVTFGHQKTTK
jgi:hypothetical protein